MQKRMGLVTVFTLFLLLSLIVIIIFRQQVVPASLTFIDATTYPLQRSFVSAFGGMFGRFSQNEELEKQNRELAAKVVDQQELLREAEALRDQYDQQTIPSQELLPAKVIGYKTFIPGVSLPEEIIIDKGSKQQLQPGQSVVLNNSLVGSIKEVSEHRSLVTLISHKNQSITAKATKTNALGIVRGKGNGVIVFENVVLSDKLEKGDIVVTKGDEALDGRGLPPDLVLGRIASVDKKASDLFQSAEIESMIDFARLTTVFVIKGKT